MKTVILFAKVVGLPFALVGAISASGVAATLSLILLPPVMTLHTLVKTLSPRRVLFAMMLTPATALLIAHHFMMGKKYESMPKLGERQWHLVQLFSTLYWIGLAYFVIRAFSPTLGPIWF